MECFRSGRQSIAESARDYTHTHTRTVYMQLQHRGPAFTAMGLRAVGLVQLFQSSRHAALVTHLGKTSD